MSLHMTVLGCIIIYLYILAGCTTLNPSAELYHTDGNLIEVGYTIADKLVGADNVSQSIGPSDPLIVASFVNVNNLEESSSFGRIMAEQVVSRFVQRGHRVIDLRLRQNSVFIKEGQGEFLLSRDIRDLSKTYNASAVVVGTYADGGDKLYVSARLVRPTDNVILSAYDTGILMDPMSMHIMLLSR